MWIELHDSFLHHPKLKRLARRLKIRIAEARGLVSGMWAWTLQMAVDGDLSSFESEDIETGIDWEGEPGAFIQAALALRLLDETEHGYAVHDWEVHAGSLKARTRKRRERERKRAALAERDSSLESRDHPEASRDENDVSRDVTQTDRQTGRNDPKTDRARRSDSLTEGGHTIEQLFVAEGLHLADVAICNRIAELARVDVVSGWIERTQANNEIPTGERCLSWLENSR